MSQTVYTFLAWLVCAASAMKDELWMTPCGRVYSYHAPTSNYVREIVHPMEKNLQHIHRICSAAIKYQYNYPFAETLVTGCSKVIYNNVNHHSPKYHLKAEINQIYCNLRSFALVLHVRRNQIEKEKLFNYEENAMIFKILEESTSEAICDVDLVMRQLFMEVPDMGQFTIPQEWLEESRDNTESHMMYNRVIQEYKEFVAEVIKILHDLRR